MVGGEDTTRTWLSGKISYQWASAAACHALIAKPDVISGGGSWASHGHAETLGVLAIWIFLDYSILGSYRWEALDGLLLQVVPHEIELSIVDSEPTLSTVGASKQGLNWNRRHAMVGAVGRVLEVQVRSPVIGEVFRHLAGSALSPGANIAGHSDIEGISANDVVDMRGRVHSRLAGRIKTLDSQSRAWEAKAGLGQRK